MASINGRVALGITPQSSHRSGRACINASGSSTDRFAIRNSPRGYPIELRGQVTEPRCVPPVSLDRFCRPTLRFPSQGPPGRVPLLRRYYQSAATSRRPSRRASLPSLGGTSVALVRFAPGRTSAPPRPGVGHPVAPTGKLPRKRQDLPSSRGTPIVRLRMFHTDAGRTAGARPLRRCGMALSHRTAKAPAKGLSTLNSMAFGLAVYASQCGLPRPTQYSLQAAGQALPDGLSTRKVPMKGFRSASYISSSLPKFSWRNR